MRTAGIISIGTELALGQTVDTNSAWLAQSLAEIGIRAQRHITVADELTPICDALRNAVRGVDVVLVTGGLGPTDDDLTRTALAQVAGVPLQRHEPSVEHLRAFFAARGRELPESNLCQAQVPVGGSVLPNTCGTAPGLHVVVDDTPIFAMPGVPFEMRAMYTDAVAPRLSAAARGGVLRSRILRTFGLGESDLGRAIADLMTRGHNPEVGTSADLGVISIRINAAAPDATGADALLDGAEVEIRQRLGSVVFGVGDDTLAAAVGGLLQRGGWTLSTAESCTGGWIGKLLTDVPGSSGYYVGGAVCYSNEVKRDLLGVPSDLLKLHGAVSAPVAAALAAGAADVFGADYAISVTGIAGPGGGSEAKPVGLVYIGLRTPGGVATHERRLGSDVPREAIRLRTARIALNLLRLELLDAAAGG